MSRPGNLLYPLYIDVPMMTSCLASLTEAYTLENIWQQNHALTATPSSMIDGGATHCGTVAQFVEAPTKMQEGDEDANRVNQREKSLITFKQSSLALLTRLRHELYHQGQMLYLDEYTPEEWDRIPLSSLVELSGEITRSPISELTLLAKRFIAVMLQSLPFNSQGNVDMSNLNPYQLNLLQNMSLFQAIIADLESSPLSDMVLRQNAKRWRHTAVLDLSTKILPLHEQELLCNGHVTVIGKVTRVLEQDETINLYRRSMLGSATRGILMQLVQSFNATPGISIQPGSGVIAYPAIEVLPIAIYV